MKSEAKQVRGFLSRLSRRSLGLLLVRSLALSAAIAIAVVLISLLIPRLGVSHGMAFVGLLIVFGASIWLIVIHPLILGWSERSSALCQARLVEVDYPKIHGRLIAATERLTGPFPGESEEIINRITKRAARSVAGLSPAQLWPSGKEIRLMLGVTLAAMALIILPLIAPTTFNEAVRFWMGSDFAVAVERDDVQRSMVEGEALGNIRLRYIYPVYTGLEPQVIPNSTGEAHGPPGTKVEVEVRAPDIITSAGLVAYELPVVEVEVVDERSLQGYFSIGSESGSYHFVYQNEEVVTRSLAYPITVEEDLPPVVALKSEQRSIEVEIDQPLAVGFTASDDYGLSKVRLTLDGVVTGGDVVAISEGTPKVSGVINQRPVDLGLSPGDRIKLAIEAWDTDTVSGSKKGVSNTLLIIVKGSSGLDKDAEERRRKLLSAMLSVLSEHLTETWPPGKQEAHFIRWGEALDRRYEPLDQALDLLLESGRQGLELELLFDIADRARELIRYTQVAYSPHSRRSVKAETLQMTSDLRDKTILALEDSVYLLDRALRMEMLKKLRADAEKLTRSAAKLESLLAQEHDVGVVLSRLEQIDRQLNQIKEHGSKLSEGSLKQFLELRVASSTGLINESRQAISDQEDQDQIDTLIGRLATALDELGVGIIDILERSSASQEDLLEQADKLREEMIALEKDQNALAEKISKLRIEADAALAKRAVSIWDQLAKDVKQVEKDGAEYIVGLELSKRSFTEIERSKSGADEVDRLALTISGRDLNGSLRASIDSIRRWRSANSVRMFEMERAGGAVPGPGTHQINSILGQLEKIDETLDQLSDLSEQVDPMVQAQVKRNIDAQEKLIGRLQTVTEMAREVARELPVTPRGLDEALQSAEAEMERADGALQLGKPMPAEGSMGAAARRIAEARDALEEAMSAAAQTGADGEPPPEGGSSDKERREQSSFQVEIPGPEEHMSPDEYRKMLLRGMEGDVPSEYETLKRRYYEELVTQ